MGYEETLKLSQWRLFGDYDHWRLFGYGNLELVIYWLKG